MKLNKNSKEKIVQMYLARKRTALIAKKFNVTSSTIYHILKEKKVPRRTGANARQRINWSKKISEISIAWAAGLIDGEGFITIIKHPKKHKFCHYLLLRVDMTHKKTIDKLFNIFQVGKVVRRSLPKKSNHAIAWSWICYGQNAVFIFNHILKYSITKKQEIETALKFNDYVNELPDSLGLTIKDFTTKENFRIKITNLKRSYKIYLTANNN